MNDPDIEPESEKAIASVCMQITQHRQLLKLREQREDFDRDPGPFIVTCDNQITR